MQSYSASWKNILMFFGKHQVFYKIMKSSSLYITAGKRGADFPIRAAGCLFHFLRYFDVLVCQPWILRKGFAEISDRFFAVAVHAREHP